MPIVPNTAANAAAEAVTNQIQNIQGIQATEQSQIAYSNALEKLKASLESAKMTEEQLKKLNEINSGSPWPQTKVNTNLGELGGFSTNAPSRQFTTTTGFLPTVLLQPTLTEGIDSNIKNTYNQYIFEDWRGQKITTTGNKWPQNEPSIGIKDGGESVTKSSGFLPTRLIDPVKGSQQGDVQYNQYKMEDWSGQKLTQQGKPLTTQDRFNVGKDLPRKNPVLVDNPHSSRDVPLIFGDSRYDYFRHGLQVIDNLTPIENPSNIPGDQRPNAGSRLRLDTFKETPWELNDPVMFGFDIIFDSQSSPLLNGSLRDFIINYSNVSEISSKYQVYEEFKHQFQKFFRVNGPMSVSQSQITMTKVRNNPATFDSSSTLHVPGKNNYLGYYIKKISGLDFLIEQNKGDTIKYTPEYKKDIITLDLVEDVTLNVGTLAHLYKTLYWSKPNGKMLVPENLLRFNCMIIVSECRNFNRVKRATQTGNVSVIKDNLSRYIYNLRECQFYFDKLPLPNDIDIGGQGPQLYENYTINFDFKYSSVKLERFVPNGDWGNYVGFDGGAIWKVGNKGTRNNRGTTGSQELSTPNFFTIGPDKQSYVYYPNLQVNGEEAPYILAVYNPSPEKRKTEDEFKFETTQNTAGSINTQTNEQGGNAGSAGQIGNISDTPTSTSSTETIDSLKQQSQQASETAKSSNQDQASQDALGGLKIKSGKASELIKGQIQSGSILQSAASAKKIPFGSVTSALNDISLSKINKTIGTPLSQIVAGASKSAEGVTGKFFDKMNSLKSESSLGDFNLSKLTSAIPSLDDVKSKFSAAKTEATSKFFDVRGNLKSSLTDGASGLLGNFGGLSTDNLLGGLTDKIKSSVPSLDSVKTKFSAAKTQATTGFFDIRGNLKSSLTDGLTKSITSFDKAVDDANSLTSNLLQKSAGAKNLVKGLLDKEINDAKSDIGSFVNVDSLKEKFSTAAESSVGSFFDIRGQISDSVGKASSLNLRKDLLNTTISKIYNTKQTGTSPIKSNTPPPTSFFDLKNQLKDFLGGTLGDKLTE